MQSVRFLICALLAVPFWGCQSAPTHLRNNQNFSKSNTLQRLRHHQTGHEKPTVTKPSEITTVGFVNESKNDSGFVKSANASLPVQQDDVPRDAYIDDSDLGIVDGSMAPEPSNPSEALPPTNSESFLSSQPKTELEQREPPEITLEDLQRLAISCSPAIQQAEAELAALRGKHTQAGLAPNPFVGVNGEDIFDDGNSGRYGILVGRKVIQASKLRRSQDVVCAEMEIGQQRLAKVVQQVITDVHQRYFRLLLAKEKQAVAASLVEVNKKIVSKSRQLFQALEVARTAVVQSELELETSELALHRANNELLAARRDLANIICEEDLPQDNIAGSLEDIETSDYELSYDRLLDNSPEML